MRRSATGASSTRPRCALLWQASMTSSMRSGLRASFERLAAPPDNQIQKIELLGKLMLYDNDLSVNRTEACAFCHVPETGFTGPVSELNRTTGGYPGSVRAFQRPQATIARLSPLSPVLLYNPGQGNLVG